MDAQTALYIYTTGLEPETSKEVRLRQPETMEQAVHQAAIVHAILHPHGPTTTTTPTPTTTTTWSDMEVDIIATVLNHLERLVQTLGQQTHVANIRRPLPKLTPQEKARLMKIGGRYKCRRRGHMARLPFAIPFAENATMPATPESYEEDRDGFECEAWLATLRCYLIGAHVPVAERTLHSDMLLKGRAALWLEGLCLPGDSHINIFVS
ncbi:hypothetical protein BGZ72_001473 [Mortierella alpina]|nr:hypothetical protein BGZ72_001473 [Mortierella alpina]